MEGLAADSCVADRAVFNRTSNKLCRSMWMFCNCRWELAVAQMDDLADSCNAGSIPSGLMGKPRHVPIPALDGPNRQILGPPAAIS